MIAKIFILVCALSAVLAYPYPYPEEYYQPELEQQYAADLELAQAAPLLRLKRQLSLQGGGGGSPGKGFDLGLSGRVPVWQSDNGRHSFDATGNYAQHLGGPYGNSRPSWGAGGVYTYRF